MEVVGYCSQEAMSSSKLLLLINSFTSLLFSYNDLLVKERKRGKPWGSPKRVKEKRERVSYVCPFHPLPLFPFYPCPGPPYSPLFHIFVPVNFSLERCWGCLLATSLGTLVPLFAIKIEWKKENGERGERISKHRYMKKKNG